MTADDELTQMFIEEAHELLANAEQALLDLEVKPNDEELIARVFRCAHTLKGNAKMLQFEGIAAFTHELENLLDKVRRQQLAVTKQVIETLLQALDLVSGMVEELSGGPEHDPLVRERLRAAIENLVAAFNVVLPSERPAAPRRAEPRSSTPPLEAPLSFRAPGDTHSVAPVLIGASEPPPAKESLRRFVPPRVADSVRVIEPAAKVAPAKAEPAKVEPAKVEPPRVETPKAEASKVEPVRTVESVKTQPQESRESRQPETERDPVRRQFVTFLVGDGEYGLEILDVREFKAYGAITHVPNMPAFLRGVMNLRGIIIPVFDLRIRFGQNAARNDMTVIVVAEVHGRTTGLVVDAVSDVIDLAVEDISDTPELASHQATSFLRGLAKLEDRLIMLLNLEELVAIEERAA